MADVDRRRSIRARNDHDETVRGASGMMGRVVEWSNGWDPAEDSVAQRTYNASLVRNKAERRRILRYVYAGSDVDGPTRRNDG